MHATDIVLDENLRAFWRVVLLHMKPYLKFWTSVLMLSIYSLKFISICENPQMTCSQFLQHLEDCFHINLALMPSHTTWLDFSNKDVSDRICSEGVTLLHKISYFKKWFKLFACPQSQQIKVTMSMYPCLTLQDAASLLMELTVSNGLRKDSEMAYNKAYNS